MTYKPLMESNNTCYELCTRDTCIYIGVHLASNVNEPVTRLGITIKQYKAVPYGRTYVLLTG